MSKKKIILIAVSVILSAVLVCCLLGYFIFRTSEKVSYDINDWSNLEKTFTYLPSVEEMGEYSDLTSKYLHKEYFIFQSDAYILKASYAEAVFDAQKDVFLNNYFFQETVLDYGEETIERDTAFRLDDFQFQMLSLEKYDLDYPKQIVFVGISEKNNEIAFVFFEDLDLDYIDASFAEFLVEECGWE